MTIYRQQDKDLSQSDNVEASPPPRSKVYFNSGVFETPWHKHEQHQLIYAQSGVIHIQTELKQFLLPAHHGLWIPAGIGHRLHSSTTTLKVWSMYFEPETSDPRDLAGIRVFPMPPLAHEMMMFSHRWLGESGTNALKESYFQTIRLLVFDWCKASLYLELPLPKDPLITDVTGFVLDHLDQPLRLNDVADRFGVSGRTLIRHFQADLGMTFGRYVQVARMAKAAELLTHPAAMVTEVALAVGYRSPSSFSQAFQLLLGQTPSEYLQGKRRLA